MDSNAAQSSESSGSGSGSGSEEESMDRAEIDMADVQLAQMRRGVQKRGHKSLKTRVQAPQGLKTYDELQKAHSFQRMKEGLAQILTLHNPVELSSLCGCLGLKAQQKGTTSQRFILDYAVEMGELSEVRMKKILTYMWEGALWEYLHSIGHPSHSMRQDPKVMVLELWQKGGLLGTGASASGFVPHFIAREVKRRNEWIRSEDIQQRLEQLRRAQDIAKVAERKVVSEHDYTNILSYFNQMGALRRLENSTREFLIQEVEILRSRDDSSLETAKMQRLQQAECERTYMSVVSTLNSQLALAEFHCSQAVGERLRGEGELQRLVGVLHSYADQETNRQQLGGGNLQALKLRHEEQCSPSIREAHRQMQQYKHLRDGVDSTMREAARSHTSELLRLTELVDHLQAELEGTHAQLLAHTARADAASQELLLARRLAVRQTSLGGVKALVGLGGSVRHAAEALELRRQIGSVRPLLRAGLHAKHCNPPLHAVCKGLVIAFGLYSPERLGEVGEQADMRCEEGLSRGAAEYLRAGVLHATSMIAGRTKSAQKNLKAKKKSGSGKNSPSSRPSTANSRPSTASSAEDSPASAKPPRAKKRVGKKK